MHTKFGVIIQGPIISYRSGGRNDNPEGFDSTDTIKKNIEVWFSNLLSILKPLHSMSL